MCLLFIAGVSVGQTSLPRAVLIISTATESGSGSPVWGCGGMQCAVCGYYCYDCSGLGLTSMNCTLPDLTQYMFVVVLLQSSWSSYHHHQCPHSILSYNAITSLPDDALYHYSQLLYLCVSARVCGHHHH